MCHPGFTFFHFVARELPLAMVFGEQDLCLAQRQLFKRGMRVDGSGRLLGGDGRGAQTSEEDNRDKLLQSEMHQARRSGGKKLRHLTMRYDTPVYWGKHLRVSTLRETYRKKS